MPRSKAWLVLSGGAWQPLSLGPGSRWSGGVPPGLFSSCLSQLRPGRGWMIVQRPRLGPGGGGWW